MKSFRNEKWKLFEKENYNVDKEKIYISNYGRVKKEVSDDVFVLLHIGKINNFETFSYPVKNSKRRKNFYLHRAVGFAFLERKDDDKFIIHINHNLTDNYYKNFQIRGKSNVAEVKKRTMFYQKLFTQHIESL